MKTPIPVAARPMSHAATQPGRFGALRSVIALILSAALFIASTGWFVYRDLALQIAGNALDISAFGTEQEAQLPNDSFAGRPVNILVSGIDSRYEQGINAHGDPEELTKIFSDVTMVMHVSADRTRVQVVSIPRDLMTDIPSCVDAEGEEVDAHWGQFNSAFATAAVTDNVGAGIACTKKTVEELSGLTIDGFVVVDFKGFVGIIDALGGVWYDVETDIEDPKADAFLSAGCQKLNGAQALSYARTRYGFEDASDLKRVGRQQKLVAAIMRETLSKNFLTDFPTLLGFVKQSLSTLKTSPNLADFNTDIGLLLSVAKIEKSGIQMLTMPIQDDPEDEFRVIALEPDANDIWRSLRLDRPFPSDTEVTTGTGQKATTVEQAQSGTAAPTIEVVPLPDQSSNGDSSTDEPVSDEPTSDELTSDDAFASGEEAPPAPPKPCPPQ